MKKVTLYDAPFDVNWPMEILNTITLTEDEGKTTLTMIVAPSYLRLKKRSKPSRIQKKMAQEGYSGTFRSIR